MHEFTITTKGPRDKEFVLAAEVVASTSREALENYNHADADVVDNYYIDNNQYVGTLFYDLEAATFYKVTYSF